MERPKVPHTFANMCCVVIVWLDDTRTIKLHSKIGMSVNRLRVQMTYRDELCAVFMYEAICDIYVSINKALVNEDTKSGTKFEEVMRVVRVHREPVVAASSIDEVLVCILLQLVLRSREYSVNTFGEAFDHLRRRFPFHSLKLRACQQTSGG